MSAAQLLHRIALVALTLLVAGCAGTPPKPQADGWAAESTILQPWSHFALPGKSATVFKPEVKDGRPAMSVVADASASMLRSRIQLDAQALGVLEFSWIVPELVADADMAKRDADDSAVRVVLAFDGDRSQFSPKNAMLAELTRTVTGEHMPYATLMYVWCNKRPVGSVIVNPRTDRVRKLVVQSGPADLGRWLEYRRDVRADFERVFGEPPGNLIGVALMSDTDNTRSQSRAWYGPVRLLPASTH